MGLQFECLVIANLAALLPLMGLDSTLLISAAPYLRRETEGRKGVQIDLLLQTRRAMYVVEIKRKGEIGESVVEEVAAKVDALRKRKGMSVRAGTCLRRPIVETCPRRWLFQQSRTR